MTPARVHHGDGWSVGSPKRRAPALEAVRSTMSEAEMSDTPFGRARRWSDSHVPGGQRTVWIVVGLLLLVLVIWAIRPSATAQKGAQGFGAGGPVPVGIATATQGDLRVTLNGLGTVTPLATVTVRPQVTGVLNRIDFQEGQMVAAGQLLAEIDPRTFQAALDQAKGQLARDEAQLTNAKLDVARYQALFKQNATSQQTLDNALATAGADAGTVRADKAAVESASVNLGYCRVTSPVTGRAGLRQVDIGNLVQSGGSSAIVVITQLQPISVLFTLPEDNIGQVMKQMNASARLPVVAFDRAQTTKLADGVLSNVDNEVDTTTGTVKMRAMFDNTDNALFPSQFVNVQLLVDTLHKQTRVPAAAIQHGAQGTYVYVIDKDSTANMRTVTTGQTDGDMVGVTSGVAPGDTVVVDGADRLRDGASVKLPDAKVPTASGAAANGPSGGAAPKHRHGHYSHAGGDPSSGGQ